MSAHETVALAEYRAALEAHRRSFDGANAACSCGWVYAKPSGRGASRALTLHITAERTRAQRAYAAALESGVK